MLRTILGAFARLGSRRWRRRHGRGPGQDAVTLPPVAARPVTHGKDEGLYRYLHTRYASAVVLTFAEIEALQGFPLADAARADRAWWASEPGGPRPSQPSAWTRSGRTAVVNLGARTVLFERIEA
jgi:hypothetical protein